MTKSLNTTLIKNLHAIWNTGNLDAIPDVYAPDVVVHWSKSSNPPQSRGYDGVRNAITVTRTAFPDWHEKVVDMITEGDRVVTRYISTGTHMGSYLGIEPTGARIKIDEISIYRIAGDRIDEQWCLIDDPTFRRQLGQRDRLDLSKP